MDPFPEVTNAQIEMQTQVYKQEWERVKKDPSHRLNLVPAPGVPRCTLCKKLMITSKVCGGCKMQNYCSAQCSKADWKRHKPQCPAIKRDGERAPRYKEVRDQFPWTNVGYNFRGQYMEDFALLQFGNIIGTSRAEVGYWATHERKTVAVDEVLDAPWNQLTEDEGWRLPKELIPSLALLNADTCPTFPLTFEANWTSYYQWRGLPISSPAALLLHWPLTVYECLKELGLCPTNAGASRRKLTVYYVGAREEVCYIPVFGELALLLHNTDLDLVFSGENTGRAVRRPRALNHGIATNPGPCVFQYTAPTSCGSTVRAFIDSNPSYYRPSRNRQEHPDAIVALNAGLGTYISWQHVLLLSSEFDIPFVVTDYNEVCTMEFHAEALQEALTSTFSVPKNAEQVHQQKAFKKVVQEVMVADVEKVCRALKRERPGKLNGFMQPGNRHNDNAPLVSAARNAWIQVITPVAKEVEGEGVGA